MPTPRQLSFLSRGPLFEDKALRAYLAQKGPNSIPQLDRRLRRLSDWNASVQRAGPRSKEKSLETDFYKTVLGEVLDYSTYPNVGATAYLKPPSRLTHIQKEPDAVLGLIHSEDEWEPIVALELKSVGTPFDIPQARESHLTPVEQAFEYGERILGVRWVLVSDMRMIRLYAVDSPHEFVEFDLVECATDLEANGSFAELFHLLQVESLVRGGEQAPTSALLAASRSNQFEIRGSFYDVYHQIRADLLHAIQLASKSLSPAPTEEEILAATQRLLDRVLFICYCEDSPDALIPRETLKKVVSSARGLPGAGSSKVYGFIKELFREIDKGSPEGSGIAVNGYNGELFKPHRILDVIELPDSLAGKPYPIRNQRGEVDRTVHGVWGLHEFDFWKELNEHLLGHIFEESLSDLVAMKQEGQVATIAQRLATRREKGVYYTHEILSDYLATGALKSFLDETVGPSLKEKPKNEKELLSVLEKRKDRLTKLKILDPACGSGAFLVSAYHGLLAEHWRAQESIAVLRKGKQRDLLEDRRAQAGMLRECLHGADLLPQAVEIAKLALWIRSARKGQKVANLGHNLVSGNSLEIEGMFERLNTGSGMFDLVIGNPPWGAQVSPELVAAACKSLGIDSGHSWDTWELFVVLALQALRPGGRLAFVLPDTLFSPEKSAIRKLIVRTTRIEKLHSLGPGWFGPMVRMGTVVLQARKGVPGGEDQYDALLLHGKLRKRAIAGEVPISQLEARFARHIPQARSKEPDFALEVFRDRSDDRIMGQMEAHGVGLASVCARGRGEEMAKSGLLWKCPSCAAVTNPGKKEKGGGFHSKKCERCGLLLDAATSETLFLVVDGRAPANSAAFLDGDDIPGRYRTSGRKRWLRTDLGFETKDAALYAAPKILLRQAGVGVAATLDTSGARCPQSVYVYRLNDAQEAWGNEFILGALLSRAMAYYVFKRFGEVDPDRAHAKLTHDRLSQLPIPRLDLSVDRNVELQRRVKANVRKLIDGDAKIGGLEDWDIELAVRELFGLTAEDGAFINAELKSLPPSQAFYELFPEERPAASDLPSREHDDEAGGEA